MTPLQTKLTNLAKDIEPLQSENKLPEGSWELILEAVNELGRLETKAITAKVDSSFQQLKSVLDNYIPPVTHDLVSDKVKLIVSEQMGCPNVAEQTTYLEMGADSLDAVELMMEFEDEFNISIPDDDWDKLPTVGDTINYLRNNHSNALNKWTLNQR